MSIGSQRRNKQAREAAIMAAIPCPVCGAQTNKRCRVGTQPHDAGRGIEDLRPQLAVVHRERRAAWVATKPK
jgi:hypothetical protein